MKNRALSVAEFEGVARAYCAWCEGAQGERTDSRAASLLCQLYAAALALPEAPPENEQGLPDIPPIALDSARTNLSSFAGRYYREFFDPEPTLDDEPVMGDIGDDLLDIYKDIRAGLVLYEREEVEEALWHWSFLHRIHWGRHVVGAMFALHCLSIGRSE